jgi:hypothetical protein
MIVDSYTHRLQIAEAVRESCESYAKETGKFDSRLSCMCAIASSALVKSFAIFGYKSQIYIIEGTYYKHAIVICDNHLYDVTATQIPTEYRRVVVQPVQLPMEVSSLHFDTSGNGFFGEIKSIRPVKLNYFKKWKDQRPILSMVSKLCVSLDK